MLLPLFMKRMSLAKCFSSDKHSIYEAKALILNVIIHRSILGCQLSGKGRSHSKIDSYFFASFQYDEEKEKADEAARKTQLLEALEAKIQVCP